MKKMLLCISLLLASNAVFCQDYKLSKTELADVLQKCIDLPQVQGFLPKNDAGSLKQLYVYYYAPEFIPADLTLSKENKQIAFKEIMGSEDEIKVDYFYFDKIQSGNSSGKITYRFIINTGSVKKQISVSVNIIKEDNTWVISDSQINVQ